VANHFALTIILNVERKPNKRQKHKVHSLPKVIAPVQLPVLLPVRNPTTHKTLKDHFT
jgi:hypothetical protein